MVDVLNSLVILTPDTLECFLFFSLGLHLISDIEYEICYHSDETRYLRVAVVGSYCYEHANLFTSY